VVNAVATGRASRRGSTRLALLAGGLAALVGSGVAFGDADDPAARAAPIARRADTALAPRAVLARQLAAEAASVERALAVTAGKLEVAQAARTERLRAAVRALHAVPGDDALAVARRRAAARWLLDRDGGERALLVDELAQLRDARARIAGETGQLDALAIPSSLARPASGKIARQFGTLAHERSGAILARRGIDLEVDEHSPATAPASGIVQYAGSIRGLDRGVILDHGGYVTVVAKLGELAVPVGAPVKTGDRIGRAARHRVYLELRVKLGPGGRPLDPEPLLAPP
jgi:murein DD-endopeptidase MepM/ murein hydrolase activator NlpD